MKPKIHGASLMRVFRTLFLLGPIFALSAVGAASAADMPVPASPTSPDPSPIFYAPAAYSWSGFYLGGNVGWGWANITDQVTVPGAGTASLSGTIDGFSGGGQAGFNWQVFPRFVVGLETDFDGAQATGRNKGITGAIGTATIASTANVPYFGTARGRFGYAYGTLLFYGTMGGAYGKSTLRGTLSTVGQFSSSADFWTWTAGFGIEAALGGHYTAKLEYLFIGAPSNMPSIPSVSGSITNSGTSMIRAGLNYRF